MLFDVKKGTVFVLCYITLRNSKHLTRMTLMVKFRGSRQMPRTRLSPFLREEIIYSHIFGRFIRYIPSYCT